MPHPGPCVPCPSRHPRPHDRAVARVERVQNAGRAECVHAAVASVGVARGPAPAIRLPEPRRVAVFPHRLAGQQVVARHHFLVPALFLRVEAIAADRKRRPARSHRPAPDLEPAAMQSSRFRCACPGCAVAVGSTKTGPVGSGFFGGSRARRFIGNVRSFRRHRSRCHSGLVALRRHARLRGNFFCSGSPGVAAGMSFACASSRSSAVGVQRHAKRETPSPVMPSVRTSVNPTHASRMAPTMSPAGSPWK